MHELAAGLLASLFVEYLITGASLDVENFLFGLPLLRQLGAGTKRRPKQRYNVLEESDRSSLKANRNGKSGSDTQIMIAHFNHMPSKAVYHKPNASSTTKQSVSEIRKDGNRETTVEYYDDLKQEDPFLDAQ